METRNRKRWYMLGLICVLILGMMLPLTAQAAKPSAPVMASVNNVTGGVKVTWGAVNGASSYVIYRRSDTKEAWKAIDTATSTSYTDKSVKSGVMYYYAISAKDAAGTEGDRSKRSMGRIFYSRPVLKSVTSGDGGLQIKWKSVAGAPRYQVLRKKSGGSYVAIGTTTGTSYLDTTMAANKTYYYSVRVVSADGKEVLTPYNSKGLSGKYVGKAQVSSLSNTKEGVKISWGAIKGAKKYNLYRKFGDGAWKKITSTTDTSFVDENVVNNIQYTYQVRALDKSGKKVCAYDKTGKSITFHVAPTLNNCVRSGSGLLTTWEAVEGVSYYAVLRKIGEGSWTQVGTSTSTSYTDNTVPSATYCKYTVRCADSSGAYISASDGYVSETSYYSDSPVMTGASSQNGYVQVSWRAVEQAEYYNIYRRTGDRTDWDDPVEEAYSGTSYVDRDVVNGETYHYTVCVADEDGEPLSRYDSTGTSTTYYIVPTKLSTSNTASGVKVSWKAVDGIGTYRVYRKTGNTGWTAIGTAYTNNFTDTTVVNNGNYRYTVCCMKSNSEVSAYNSTGSEIQFHTAPTVSAVTATASGITISWGAVDGIGTYRIYRKTGSGSLTALGDVSSTSYADTDGSLAFGTTYTYAVRCVLDGSVVSGYMNTLALTYMTSPDIKVTFGGEKKAVVSWKAVSGASSYVVYRKTSQSGYTALGTVTTLNYTDTTGAVNTVYTYKVVALASNGSRSLDSNEYNYTYK